jgi:hypothetical protein
MVEGSGVEGNGLSRFMMGCGGGYKPDLLDLVRMLILEKKKRLTKRKKGEKRTLSCWLVSGNRSE